ncbi:hypothetical protein QFW85_26845 [Vibrio chagasii]|uniref:hypothetical protein n=1 Tax=Vibrio chagasii TaxID=170679 RepID=UPI003DA9616A
MSNITKDTAATSRPIDRRRLSVEFKKAIKIIFRKLIKTTEASIVKPIILFLSRNIAYFFINIMPPPKKRLLL